MIFITFYGIGGGKGYEKEKKGEDSQAWIQKKSDHLV